MIAHEYGHGISTRLTGGPQQSGCLGGDEQMGEGWSDFFTLITSVEAGDVGSDIRGIGTYVMRQFTEGKGFRTYPYSTDMNINPFTYKNIISETVPHGVGAVWSTMLWDLYWAFVDAYGWDPNLIGGTGGNNMAIQLVMDGMKMQPCDPGFVDGRDAILDADQALFGGANQCLIWEVFARRGLGYFADQGSSFSRGDGKENFDPLPTCIPELKISKTATDFIQPGDDINYTIKVVNHKPEAVTNVVVTDELPAGVSYKAGSGSITPTVNGNLLSFELGTMVYGDEVTITFKGESDPGQYSIQHYLEEFEESTFGIWVDYPAGTVEANNEWVVQSQVSFSPTKAFFVPSLGTESQQILQLVQAQPVQGDVPVLRFYHRYQTQPGADGGYVQVSVDEGNNWVGVANKFLQNGYPGPITYTTFVVPNLSAFTGNSNGFIPSYVDLSEYAGEDIQFRFKFGTDESIAEGAGWYVDDVEMMDLLSYNSEACVSSDEGDQACASAPSLGTIVDSQLPDAVEEVALDGLTFSVFPNPARDILNIRFTADHPTDISLKVITLDGKEMLGLSGSLIGTEILPVDVSQLPKGMYVMYVITEGGSAIEKVFVD
ncbi:MAG: M36 family metallopeptidase [Saprospirales bacterium]|nr:M36 family metallopeptidase [Saprospirales bacterium]